MTAQVPDRFDFEGHEYSLVGVKGGRLFDPEQFGLKPVGTCTACWRGYECRYTVEHDRLLLIRLEITLGDHAETIDTPLGSLRTGKFTSKMGPELHGVHPIEPKQKFGMVP